nr:zinc finger, CCHC-type [Tanacetum cinerariifolium]
MDDHTDDVPSKIHEPRKGKRDRKAKSYGFDFQEGIDYFETYAPVARITTIRLLLALSAIYNLVIRQMDVKTAFLNGDLDAKVYMKQPKSFVMPVDKTKKFLSSRFSMKDMGEADVILDCSSVSTPMDPVENIKPNTGKPVDQLEYSRAIDCLMYAMTSTRPDIAYAVGRLNRWVFLIEGCAISWVSKKQKCITGSTMESEFIALAATGKEAEWLRNLIHEITIWSKPIAPISIRCDSPPKMAKTYSQVYNGKSRHLETKLCTTKSEFKLVVIEIRDCWIVIVLSIDDKLNYLEQPIPPAVVVPAGQHVAPEILACHTAWIKGSKEIEEGQSVSLYVLKMKGYINNLERLGHPVTLGLGVSLILIGLRKEFDGFVQNYNMHILEKTSNELHAMLKLHEQTLPKNNAPALHAIRAGKVQKVNKHKNSQPQMAARRQNHGKGKNKLAYAPKPKIPLPPKREDPAKDSICHECGETGHWKRNCPQYLAELLKKKKNVASGSGGLGLRASRKLKPGALSLYVGNGQREAVEAIDGFINRFMNNTIQVSRNNMVYFSAISRDGIFEIDLSNSYTNESSIYAVSNKRAKLDLDSALLWHCCLGHISKKRIEKLQHDGLLNSTDLRDFKKYVSYTSLNHEEDDLEIDKPQSDIVSIRRSTRTRHAPDRMCLYINAEEHELGDLGEPANYKVALLDHEFEKWLNAMNVEMQSMKDNEVWVLVELFPNGKTIGSKWLFKKKTNMDGVVHTYKARLVAKGYTQTLRIDYEETFSSVADIRAIRILIAIAAYYDFEIWQMDVKTTFLCGYLNEEVYMEQPEGGDLKRELRVSCYTDAGYLTDADDLKSQTGYVFILNGGSVDWKSSKQSIFATSSAEDEYIVTFDASKEAVWDRKFISELGVVPKIKEPISMYCDNTRAIAIANESGITKGARHLRAKVHYLREVIEHGDIKSEKVYTDDNLADPFTKALAYLKYSEHTRNIRMFPAKAPWDPTLKLSRSRLTKAQRENGEPKSYLEALSSKESIQWKKAIKRYEFTLKEPGLVLGQIISWKEGITEQVEGFQSVGKEKPHVQVEEESLRSKASTKTMLLEETYVGKVLEKINMNHAAARCQTLGDLFKLSKKQATKTVAAKRIMSKVPYSSTIVVTVMYNMDNLCFSKKEVALKGFSASEYRGCLDSGKSTMGYVFTKGGTIVCWMFRLEKCVAVTTTQAGYVVVLEAGKELPTPKRHRSCSALNIDRVSPNKTSTVYKKTSLRSDLRWKLTSRIFKSVGLRWIPIGKLFNSCMGKDDSEPTDELESLFGPLFDEYFNGENQVVSNPSAVTTADASDKRQQQPDSTSSTLTLATTVTADKNIDM